MKTLWLCVILLVACQRAEPVRTLVSLPGAESYSKELAQVLAAAVKKKGASYKPRTRHLLLDGSAQYTNRLALEPSPYLQQHAHNPVNWYAWGAEAFEAAKRLDRPIFLSIGYSTCHWCHVMEEESFEDVETARYLNENYIAIKVDREERPDVDSIYMNALHAMGQNGGWPLNLWLTPDKRPFYGGTYFPKDNKYGRSTFMALLKELKAAFKGDRNSLLMRSQKIVDLLQKKSALTSPRAVMLGQSTLDQVAQFIQSRFDSEHGGLLVGRGGTKFPSSMPIRFLLRYYRQSRDSSILGMVTRTLDKMAFGGLYDQVGGGFHRYSTDSQWQVPHFEKMLYDNALLATAYLEGYQVTKDTHYKTIAIQVLDYITREMTSPEGGFYSAADADSIGPAGEREEGYYFTWTPAETQTLLGKKKAALVNAHYAIVSEGNFEGRSIPHRTQPLSKTAKEQGLALEEAEVLLSQARWQMLDERSKRLPPSTDDKILVAWNGLMISAYAQAAQILRDDRDKAQEYLVQAKRAATFILSTMRKDKRLLRSYQGGKAHLRAYLEDYSFMIAGLLELFQASHELHWLNEAVALQSQLDKHYSHSSGGYYMTADDHESLLVREKPTQDGAIPSGNSYAILNLLRLHQWTGQEKYLKLADAGLQNVASDVSQNPMAYSELLLALDFRLDTVKQIAIVKPQSAQASSFADVWSKVFSPNHMYVEVEQGKELNDFAAVIPWLKAKVAIKNNVTAYVCEDSQCDLPTSDPLIFKKQISTIKK